MVDRKALLEQAQDCVAYPTGLDGRDYERDIEVIQSRLLEAIAIGFVIVADVLVEECKNGGAIENLRWRRAKRT